MAGDISEKQKQILEYIKTETLKRGYPPSVREICTAVRLKSTSSVHAHLSALEEKGFIRRDPTKPRAIEILDEDFYNTRCDEYALSRREMVNVPIIGTVTAGLPILAHENIEDYFPMPVEFLPNAVLYMLKVRGDSMINAGIFSGDTVIVEQRSTAKNGDIVVALVEDSATIKRFYKENGRYRLQPENDSMDPIMLDHVEILGKVIGLVRMNM